MSIEAAALYLLSPLTITLLIGLGAIACAALGWRRGAAGLAGMGFAFLWFCSTPFVADALLQRLEGAFLPVAAADSPEADAALLLGGVAAGVRPPERPTLLLGMAASRVWHAAALYHARKVRWVVVAAGNRSGPHSQQAEADALAEVLIQLGVPDSAIVRETSSRTTRENARNVLPILRRLGAKRVLLVTSSQHMPRAMKTFEVIWGAGGPQLIAAPTDRRTGNDDPFDPEVWLPSLSALQSVNTSLKEFAGMAALGIIQ